MKRRRGVSSFKGSVIWEEDKLRSPEVSELVVPSSEKAVPPGTTTMNSVARGLEPAEPAAWALRSELRCCRVSVTSVRLLVSPSFGNGAQVLHRRESKISHKL